MHGVKVQMREPPWKSPSRLGAGGPARAGQRDAREEGGAGRADAGVGGLEGVLGRQDVGALQQHLGGDVAVPGGHDAGAVEGAGGRDLGRDRAADQHLQGVPGAVALLLELGHGDAGRLDLGVGGGEVEVADPPGLGGAADQVARRGQGVQRGAGQHRLLVEGPGGQVGGGHLGHQRDLERLLRLLGGEVDLQRGVGQALDPAEEIELEGGQAEPDLPGVGDGGAAGGGQVGRDALPGHRAAGGHHGQPLRPAGSGTGRAPGPRWRRRCAGRGCAPAPRR